MKKTTAKLADGRELIYYDSPGSAARATPADRRPLEPATSVSQARHDPLLDERVGYATHRQGRTYHPPADQCPLCPTQGDRLTEVPADDYQVVVFENRFPSFSGDLGRCEVVCFTPEHRLSFADLTVEQAALVLHAWTDRTAELSRSPGVREIFCFENRGREIGVTLDHPHGQIYGYPFTTPHTQQLLRSVAAHREKTGGNLFDELIDRERADGRRVIMDTEHWTAFVPYAARWPYEVHLYPTRRVPDLLALDEAAQAALPAVYLELLRRFDRLFGPDAPPTPYISGWHQAPFSDELEGARREDFALHLELFTTRRGPGKLKHLAGSESGARVFVNDVLPEAAAARLKEVATR